MKCFTQTFVSALLLSSVALTLATEDSELPRTEAHVEPESSTVSVQLNERGFMDVEL